MPVPTSSPFCLKLDTEAWSPWVTPGPRPRGGNPNLIYQVTSAEHLPAAAALPEAEPENPGNVPPHQPSCNRDKTCGGKSRGIPRSASSQAELGSPAHRLPLHHIHSGHVTHALSRPTAAVLNWMIPKSTKKTTKPKQAACCK